METYGKVVMLANKVEGESPNGFWKKVTLVVSVVAQKEKKLAFEVFGEKKVNAVEAIKPGTLVRVNFSIESEQYGEKWFTKLSAISVEPYIQQQQTLQEM